MSTVLITGANRGLGLEFVRQYAAAGWRVLACCRNPQSADDLKAIDGDVAVFALDVSDFAAIDVLATELKNEAIDVLINNAGVFGPDGCPLAELSYEDWEQVLRVNILAPTKITEAFLPHVEASEQKKVVFLSSVMGSIEKNEVGSQYIYRSSKAGLNGVIKSLSIDLKGNDVSVLALHPGWVQTDMGGPNADITADQSIAGMRNVISDLSIETSGTFYGFDGVEIPW